MRRQHSIRHTITAALCAACLFASAAKAGETAPTLPTLTGSIDSLDVYLDGKTIHLLAGNSATGDNATGDNGADGKSSEKAETKPAVFRHTVSTDGGRTWRAPVQVNAPGAVAPVPHHRGSDAKIIARGQQLFAVWTVAGTGFKGTGPMGTAVSTDGGLTWQPGPNPADHDSSGSHRFFALADDGKAFHLVWLDDREKQRGLRHASSIDGGKTWSKNTTIDEFVCACCWNTLRAVKHGERTRLWVLYRDIEPSDMGVAVSDDGGKSWQRQGHAGAFEWIFKGCPHVGGGVVALPAEAGKAAPMLAAIWTGKLDSIGCHLVRGDWQGKDLTPTWVPTMRLGGATARDPEIVVDAKGTILAAWDEVEGDDRSIFARTSTDGGRNWSRGQRVSAEKISATHARAIANPAGEGFILFWTQMGEAGKPVLAAKAVR